MRTIEYEYKNGNIPPFFAEIWAEGYVDGPIENQSRYEVMVKRQEKYLLMLLVSGVFTLFLTLMAGIVYTGTKSQSPWIFAGSALLLISTIYFAIMYIKLSPEKSGKVFHFRDYYCSLEELFDSFTIPSSPSIGKLSKEEFTKAIAGSLRTMAKRVDPLEGFERVSAMNDWKAHHRIAREWGLCDEKYDKYWPQKSSDQ